ncbi:MAG: thrombospondin type 3 repeat-containing protein [Proteobacteria bacterium]|nr:thrombospondin type 3 repeat-containing protein [Pseudomonadota bacterium]
MAVSSVGHATYNVTVEGRVTCESGAPIEGVTLYFKFAREVYGCGFRGSATTDADGNYSLTYTSYNSPHHFLALINQPSGPVTPLPSAAAVAAVGAQVGGQDPVNLDASCAARIADDGTTAAETIYGLPTGPDPDVLVTGVDFQIAGGCASIPDFDGDGVDDSIDNCVDIANADQADLDADGLGNACDSDDDGDSIEDGADNCPEVYNPDQIDLDGNLAGDACDPDDDGDSIEDDADNCPGMPNTDQSDLDADAIGDVCDEDKDGDGVLDTEDNCGDLANPDQADFDNDGVGDACDETVGTGEFEIDPGFFTAETRFHEQVAALRAHIDALPNLTTKAKFHALLDRAVGHVDKASQIMGWQLTWCTKYSECKNLARRAHAEASRALIEMRDMLYLIHRARCAREITWGELWDLRRARRDIRYTLRDLRRSIRKTLRNIRRAL